MNKTNALLQDLLDSSRLSNELQEKIIRNQNYILNELKNANGHLDSIWLNTSP